MSEDPAPEDHVLYSDLGEGVDVGTFANKGILGYGAEGTVLKVEYEGHEYALKTFNEKYTWRYASYMDFHRVLEAVDCEPILHYAAVEAGFFLVLTDVYDITLNDYIEQYPSEKEHVKSLCLDKLSALRAMGYYPYDFTPHNIMLNLDDPDRLVFIDASVEELDDQSEDVIQDTEEFVESW